MAPNARGLPEVLRGGHGQLSEEVRMTGKYRPSNQSTSAIQRFAVRDRIAHRTSPGIALCDIPWGEWETSVEGAKPDRVTVGSVTSIQRNPCRFVSP